jgi:hypothetical protein
VATKINGDADDKANPESTKDLPLHRTCATMQVHHRLLSEDARYAASRERIEELAFLAESGMTAQRSGCTQIPVVVHVVHRVAAENISDAQIASQIRILNEDFRKQNADVVNIPAPYQALAADARISFKLAAVDPSGAPTNGITRTSTTVNGFSGDDAVKSSSTGGANAWPADQYLNIWVCKLSGGLLGYAQFPGGPAATDGVVCTYTAFGTEGTAAAPFNKGRTATHEVGHWLNLRHIWGDDGDGCGGSDFVADTPNQAGPNTGLPTFPRVTCSNGPHGDMFMNYMDYTDDMGMFMFTSGQVTRMQACLDGPRSSIGVSVPCGGVIVKPQPKDFVKDSPKDFAKDNPKDLTKDGVKDRPKDLAKDNPKDFAKDQPKDGVKDRPKDLAKDNPKDFAKDQPKDGVKDRPKDFIKDRPKEQVLDPQKQLFENPKGLDGGPLVNPAGPLVNPGIGVSPTPFVLGGGVRADGVDPGLVLAVGWQVVEALGNLAQSGLLTQDGIASAAELEASLNDLQSRMS